MKSIQFNGKTIIAVHVLTKVTDGNHVPFTTSKTYTLFDKDFKEYSIDDYTYSRIIAGSGIRLYGGTIERGGGRHSFYGTDLAQVVPFLKEQLYAYNSNA